MPLDPDDLVAGRYRVVRLIGRGGMAAVHLARDERLGRDVALKALAHHLADDPAAIRRLRREASSVAALNHPNVVTLHDVVDTDDELVLVMEHVEGPTLADRLGAEGPLPVVEAVEVARDVAAGLAAAHARGIVHRDVTPGNVLLAPTGDAKVADFGIARATATPSTATSVMGTLPYLPPEQARGGVPDPRGDLYALGCVLVEMLTGQPPFTGASPAAVLAQHLDAAPPLPGDRRPAVPAALDELVAALLAKDPDERPATAEDVRAALVAVGATVADARPPSVRSSTDHVAGTAATTRVPGSAGATGPGSAPDGAGTATAATLRHGTAAASTPTGAAVWSPRRRRGWAGAAVALAALLALAWTSRGTPADVVAVATPSEPATAAPSPEPIASSDAVPSPDPVPSPTADASTTATARAPAPSPSVEPRPTTPADGVARLRATLADGVAEGLVGATGVDGIDKRIAELAREITRAVGEGDGGALDEKRAKELAKRVERLHEEIADRVEDGDLDDRLARRLASDVDGLALMLGVESGEDGDR